MSSVFNEEIELGVAVSQLSTSIWTISGSSSISCRSSGMSRYLVVSLIVPIDVFCGLFCQLVVACCFIRVDVDWWFVNYQLVVIFSLVSWVLLGGGGCYVRLWLYWGWLVCRYNRYEFSVFGLLCYRLGWMWWVVVRFPGDVWLANGLCGWWFCQFFGSHAPYSWCSSLRCRPEGCRVVRFVNCHWATLGGVRDQVDDFDWFICLKFGCI